MNPRRHRVPTEPAAESFYKKPLTPETGAVLAKLEAKARAPKKARKKAAPKKRTRQPSAPQASEHVVAWHEHRRTAPLAAFVALYPPAPLRYPPDWHVLTYRHRQAAERTAAWNPRLEAANPTPA